MTRSLVTLLTDFGLRDPFVGVMKGVILGSSPKARVIDLCHGIPPHDIPAGAFWIAKCYRYFPRGTVHVCVVDPGVGSARRALLVAHDGHHFIAPDNGLLSDVFRGPAPTAVWELVPNEAPHQHTFHGRDLFAPAAAQCLNSTTPGEQLEGFTLRPVNDPVSLTGCAIKQHGERIQGRVLLKDHFGNLMTNLEMGPPRSVAHVEHRGKRLPWVRSYSDVAPGQPLALENAWGVVELAIREGDASERLSGAPGDIVTLVLSRPITAGS